MTLTVREKDILRCIVEGHDSKVIARRLGISPRTVDVHRDNIKNKLAARNIKDLIRIAITQGLAA